MRPFPVSLRLFGILAAACAASLLSIPITHAANPPAGTVDPSTVTPVEWDGTAVGTGGTDETTAIEGVNRDTFILHVAAGNYTGKTIAVKIEWTSGSNDYDLYIHKRNADGSDGDLVSSWGGGVPSTSESTVIDPNSDGTGDFNVIAVYFINTPGVDQPHGTITVLSLVLGTPPPELLTRSPSEPSALRLWM